MCSLATTLLVAVSASAGVSGAGLPSVPGGTFIEAEEFTAAAHWEVQSKLKGFSGKGYLINGRRPAVLASSPSYQASLPHSGEYAVWVRAYRGGEPLPGFHDREFALEVNGNRLAATHLGMEGEAFAWELAGQVDIDDPKRVEISIHDLGRAEAIIDCVLLTDDVTFRPPGWTGNSTRPAQGPFAALPPRAIRMGEPFRLAAAPREHVETITGSPHVYRVEMGGTLDEFNTARYVDTYNFSKRLESGFQPNHYVVMENVGHRDAINPRIVINGRRDWFSAETILAGLLKPDMSDAEKALAIWAFTSRIDVQAHENNRRVGAYYPDDRSHPSRNTFQERGNPVKAANLYYCSGCQYGATTFAVLARCAGLPSRCVWMCPYDEYENHCVAETFYDGAWHLFDPERRSFYLTADNTTAASYEMLHNHPELAERTHDGGFASKYMGMKSHAQDYQANYPPPVMPIDCWTSTMGITLRPGEKLIWRWTHDGKFRSGQNPRNRNNEPYCLANGKLVYQPDLESPAARGGMLSERNVKTTGEDGDAPTVHADRPGLTSYVIYKMATPYPIVGGVVGGRFFRRSGSDALRILLSVGDSDWTEVWSAGPDDLGAVQQRFALDDMLQFKFAPPRYECYVKYEFRAADSAAAVGLDDVYLELDLQMASTSLPSLSVGDNEVVYRDDTAGEHAVRITHGWEESPAARPPAAPGAAVSPSDGAVVNATSLSKLAWQPAADPERREIADYHVQVSPRHDFAFPVSPNFDRLTFSGEPQWEVPLGWLVPGQTYFWRVRAKNKEGVWSAWSDAWRFSCPGQ